MSEKLTEAHDLVVEAKRIAALPALLHRFLDTSAEAIVIADKDGKIALFNRKATFLFGWSPEQVIGQPVEILLPEALREIHAKAHRPGYGRDPYPRAMGANLDLLARHRDGSTFPVVIDLHPELSEDGTLFVRAAIRRREEVAASLPISPPHESLLLPDES
jgi:PAS domain S-box-containing protein